LPSFLRGVFRVGDLPSCSISDLEVLMPGPAPQEKHTRKSNDRQSIKLVADGKTRGPSLPRGLLKDSKGNAEAWHPATVKWWNSWRKSPQAVRMMTGPDWDFLLDTALVHHEYWKTRRFELAGELRLRVQQFGATPEARARLRVEVATDNPNAQPETSAPAAGQATVTSIDARRDRLTAEG
jgi:hypothetical protein